MRFIGNKEKLVLYIEEIMAEMNVRGDLFFDIFTGTTSVAKHFKKRGYRLIVNDNLYFSHVLQKTYIENNQYPGFLNLTNWLQKQDVFNDQFPSLQNALIFLNNLRGFGDYFYENYAPGGKYNRMYLTDKNSKKLDSISKVIYLWRNENIISFMEECILKTAILEAIPKVSNISGTYGAYLKTWDNRALKSMVLKPPIFIHSEKQHYCFNLDANELIRDIECDILYIDPPYNGRQYISNYHVLESIAKYDKLELRGKTGLRADDQIYKSKYSLKTHCEDIFEDLINNTRAKYILMSYNSEGIIPASTIKKILSGKGKSFLKIDKPYRRFKSNSNGNTRPKVIESIYYIEIPVKRKIIAVKGRSNKSTRKISEQLKIFKLDAKINKKENSKIDLGKRGIFDKRNTLNDLTGREWVYRTNSIELFNISKNELKMYDFIREIFETKFSTRGSESYSHSLRSIHPSPKPPQLMVKLIEFFTKKNGLILDPFMGVGGTLIAASLTGRKAVGIDLSSEFIDVYFQVSEKEKLKRQVAVVGNSKLIDEIPIVNSKIFDLILTDPPYGNMMAKRKTGESSKRKKDTSPTPFSDNNLDIGNLAIPDFLNELKLIIEKSCLYLKNKGYLVLFTKDFQPKENYLGLLHADIIEKLAEIENLSYKGYKIWYDKTINLYPYGYPYAYIGNQLHQFILIFRKQMRIN